MPRDIVSLYRARLAKERGTVTKDWGGKLSVALAYPNHYRLGMSNLGFQIVYHLLNERADVVAERVFLPEGQEMSLYLQSGKPLFSLESQRPLRNFDLLTFSISFENDYPNVLKILEMGKIPLLSENRPMGCPFVLAGGITTFLNPEPLAVFMDFFLLGEAEANLKAFIEQFILSRLEHNKRDEILYAVAKKIVSAYVPSLYQPEYHEDGTLRSFSPRKRDIPEKIKVACDSSPTALVPISSITTPDSEFSDMVLVELGRGCSRSCRFCAAGYVYRPPRAHSELELRKAVKKAMESSDRIGLISAAVSDIPGIENLTGQILENGGRFSVSSLRANTLTQGLLEHLRQTGQKTLAIAPEAGSQRLRKVINKHLTEDQIIDAVHLIARVEKFDFRLYFMIGLPTETHDDISEILALVKRIKHTIVKASAARGRLGRIKLSVNCFVPKPFTPFQWLPLQSKASLKEKQKWLKKAFASEGGVTASFDVPKWAYIQTLLAMGDRRVGQMLLKTHRLGGDWIRALRFSDVNPDFFVYRPKSYDEKLPWDFIDHGILKEHLKKEHEQALEGKETEICHVGECYRCGVCRKNPS